MLLGKRILVVIPARGGSKGIPRKNIALVAGKPLIRYTTELLEELHWVDKAVVSTDDQQIADAALVGHTVSVSWRPENLSGDRVGDMPVLAHALAEAESNKTAPFDIVVMLQPTSPLRTATHVHDCVEKLIQEKWDAVWTVSKTDSSYHPQKQVKVLADGSIEFYLKSGASVVARQELAPAFHRNGVAYAFSRDFVRNAKSVFSPGKTSVLLVEGHHISIDTPADIAAVERSSEIRRGA